jgi:protein-S-isoprenylcysteine O-methyltransferase Ste14
MAPSAPPAEPGEIADRPNRTPWPPIIYAAVLIAAWVLEGVVPLPAAPENLLVRWLGGAIFLAGLGLGLAGLSGLWSEGTTFDPTGRATALATEGVYRWSRNPMYLAALVCIFGLALAFRSTWLLVAVPATALALMKLAIEPEEAYLERRFGAAYRTYRARVRRWI